MNKLLNNISNKEINNIDISFLSDCFSSESYIYGDSEHYKLLTWFSKNIHNSRITEIGSMKGISAECLAQNHTNTVVSYDISDKYLSFYKRLESKYENLTFKNKNVLYDFNHNIFKSSFIFIDVDPHNGEMEKQALDVLAQKCKQTYILFDDIYLNPSMVDFWAYACKNYNAVDLTQFGHFSGSGLVIIDNL